MSAAALMEEMLLAGYVRIHWRPAGSRPEGEVSVKVSVALPFAIAVADDKANVPCADRLLIGRSKKMNAKPA